MNFEQALKEFRNGRPITDGDVVLRPGDAIKDLNLDMCMQCDWVIYDEPKWEPKGGVWLIMPHGVDCPQVETVHYKNFGVLRPNKEQAKAARDKMRTFNRLLAWLDEHCKTEYEMGFEVDMYNRPRLVFFDVDCECVEKLIVDHDSCKVIL